tara:strand:- start:188 stop:409 length:222 start_codon:yes stop_codon:yes gene_type:complete
VAFENERPALKNRSRSAELVEDVVESIIFENIIGWEENSGRLVIELHGEGGRRSDEPLITPKRERRVIDIDMI